MLPRQRVISSISPFILTKSFEINEITLHLDEITRDFNEMTAYPAG
jgi:hypothetical protein